VAKDRVRQIYHNGGFVDGNGKVQGKINTLILSHEKKLAVEFRRKPNVTNQITMRVRRMSPTEIHQNQCGQNHHFNGPRN